MTKFLGAPFKRGAMVTPFFSVVIPTYNRSGLLKEAVHSIMDQSFEDFELLIVDDHSSDDTKNVVASFKDSRIKYISNDRTKGGAGTRNAGIFRAKGRWVAFLDDDDVWLSNKLELQYKKIQEVDSVVGLVYSGSAGYDFAGKRVISEHIPEKEGWIQEDLLYKNYIGTFSRVVIRADILKKVGGLDERFEAAQDWELCVRLAGTCKIAFIKEILTYSRFSNKDRITLNPEKKLKSALLFWQKYEHLIKGNFRLRYHAATQVFVLAFKQRDMGHIIRVLPWTFAGLFFDIENVSLVFGTIYYQFIRNPPPSAFRIFSRKNRIRHSHLYLGEVDTGELK